MEKGGMEMLWSTWVIMIIAMVLFVFLLTFFAMGSGNFLQNVKSFFSKVNVDSVVKGCNILVDSGNKYDFCCDNKTVKYLAGKDIKSEELKCFELMNKSYVNNQIKAGIDCGGYNC